MKNLAILIVIAAAVAAAFLLYAQSEEPIFIGSLITPSARSSVLRLVPVQIEESGSVAGVTDEETAPAGEETPDIPLGQTVIDIPAEPFAVSVRENGFAPVYGRVLSGTAVTWTNDSSHVIEIAPDDHPSHQRYQGVWEDVGAGRIAPGETYTFIFSVPGSYSYHNHLIPEQTGTITVSEQE